ncbi:MAG TPA: FAD-binding protein [Candidatus Megaira endosymbiont of Hartmannula sinica]|nr:FAD-binding protein [Candidatus Megaera endosymbiont of Hartmannula sinica]
MTSLYAALKAYQQIKNVNIVILSKAACLTSASSKAQGGINAALGNVIKDKWWWHAYDTIKSGGGLCDEDSVYDMCKEAPEIIRELSEEIGVDFDKDKEGKIKQKKYGGQKIYPNLEMEADINYEIIKHKINKIEQNIISNNNLARRACYVKDKTGLNIINSLLKKVKSIPSIKILDSQFVCDLIIKNKDFSRMEKDNIKYHISLSIDTEKNIINYFYSKYIIIASGGYSNIYKNNTSSNQATGDLLAIALKKGFSLKNMEFIQFHPTALNNKGILISEAARAMGGNLLNCYKERFMKKYDPAMMELSTRDVISQAISQEITMGFGVGSEKNAVWLDITNMSEDFIKKELPTLYNNCVNNNINPAKEYIEISPAAHYSMGGIACDNQSRIVIHKKCDKDNNKYTILDDIYVCGEAACVSVHGANRLGCNSLLELFIFAKKAIISITRKEDKDKNINDEDEDEEINTNYDKTNLYVKNKLIYYNNIISNIIVNKKDFAEYILDISNNIKDVMQNMSR